MKTAVFAMGCFWVSSASSGNSTACTRPSSDMPVATHRTPRTKRSAPDERGTPKPSPSSTTRTSSATNDCSRPSGRVTTPPRGCGRATTSVASYRSAIFLDRRVPACARGVVPRDVPERLDAAGFGEITTEVAPLELEAGFSTPSRTPAVPRQEPERLLRCRGTGVSCPIGSPP